MQIEQKPDYRFTTSITTQQAVQLAKKAISNRLYVSGWLLRNQLEKLIVTYGHHHTIVLCESVGSNKPIAVGIRNNETNCVMIFVRKAERRKGIGTVIGKILLNEKAWSLAGIDASVDFWNSLGYDIW